MEWYLTLNVDKKYTNEKSRMNIEAYFLIALCSK